MFYLGSNTYLDYVVNSAETIWILYGASTVILFLFSSFCPIFGFVSSFDLRTFIELIQSQLREEFDGTVFFMDNQANQSPIVNIKFVCLSTAATMVVKTVSVVMTVIWFGLLQLYISIIFLMIRYLKKANDIQSNYLQKRKKRMTNVGSFIVQC